MSKIVFRPSLVNDANDKLSSEIGKLSSEKSEFFTTWVRMDSKVLARNNLSLKLSEANSSFTKIEEKMREINKVINFAEKEYFKAENKIKVLEAGLLDSLQINPIMAENLNKEKKKGNGEFGIEYVPNATYGTIGAAATRVTDIFSLGKSFVDWRRGFRIEKYMGSNGELKYRVKKPEVVGIKPPRKGRKDYIYQDNHVKTTAKNGNAPKAAKFFHPGTGAKAALKTKLGWLGVGLTTGDNLLTNLNPEDGNVKVEKVVGDAVVDVGLGAVSLAAGGAISALAVTAGAPVIVGAAVAFGVSMLASTVLDGIKVGKGNKKDTISNHLKNGVQSVGKGIKKGFKTVAGWFK